MTYSTCILGRICFVGKGLPCGLVQAVQDQTKTAKAGALRDANLQFVMLRIPRASLNTRGNMHVNDLEAKEKALGMWAAQYLQCQSDEFWT